MRRQLTLSSCRIGCLHDSGERRAHAFAIERRRCGLERRKHRLRRRGRGQAQGRQARLGLAELHAEPFRAEDEAAVTRAQHLQWEARAFRQRQRAVGDHALASKHEHIAVS
ncbi:MAG: hypothetical protein N3B15_07600 [Planctomycetota bacterium]|nr:hypothetical protein [Planctomycetota bacterium]